MEVDQKPKVTSDHFLKLRSDYLADRNPLKGVEILQKLVTIQDDQVDENAWLDCKDLLRMILEDIPTSELLSKYQILYLQAVPNSPANVVDVLASMLAKKASSTEFLSDSAVAVAVSFARRIDERECFESIAQLIAAIASKDVIVTELKDQLAHLTGQNKSENRFRLYQVVVEAMKSNAYNENLQFLLDSLIDDVSNTSDVLTQLSALELVGDCAITNESSAKVLNDLGVPRKVYEMLLMSKYAPDGGFLFSACIRFFGHLTRQYPEAIDTFPDFVPFVVDLVSHFDLLDASQRVLAFDTFANIAYTVEAKKKLEAVFHNTETLGKVLRAFGAAMNHGPIELRVRHVNAASLMFEQANHEVAHRWHELMGGNPFVSTVLSSVQKPFVDIRAAFLQFLLTIFEFPSIIIEYVRFAGFNEWLLSEITETEYETAQLKKSIIRKMIHKSEEESKGADEKILGFESSYIINLKASLMPPASQPHVELAL